MKKNVYVVIHGHFYQPPRENPWTMEIEKQPSAYPYHDWNERINEECFSANIDSRLLDGYGHIRNIIDNYEHINFDIGPTLFSWLEKHKPEVYKQIIEADKKSLQLNNGHGNAIAMAYNHPILTLCNDEDIDTQIRWGLAEFKHRFGRDSESIWLPETAVNMRVVEKLVEHKIKYIILSPTQADKVRYSNSDLWTDVSDNSIDISKPYYINTSKGQLAVFFYDGGISTAISFEHLLMSAENFKNRLLSLIDNTKSNQLISVATDGEVYGHHEPFGDMCLAALISNNQQNKDFIITNYGNYLELFPPKDEVMIKSGSNGLGTAWSCAHGVGRWLENCGCKVGGDPSWNQEWRRPFREALDYLRDSIRPIFENELSKYVKDVWEARNDYIYYILERNNETLNTFLKKHSKKDLTDEEITILIRFMESQRFAMYMYTSCAWFFTEISGIETVQNMKYAKKSIEHIDEFLNKDIEQNFKKLLKVAKSNIYEFQNGEWIYENFALASKLSEEKIISQFLFYKIVVEQIENTIYFYKIEINEWKKIDKEESIIHCGIINVYNSIDFSNSKYIFYIIHTNNVKMQSYLRKYYDDELKSYIDKIVEKNDINHIIDRFKEWFLDYTSLEGIEFEYREKILNAIFKKTLSKAFGNNSVEIDDILNITECYRNFGVEIPDITKVYIQNKFNSKILSEINLFDKDIDNVDFQILERILKTSSYMLNTVYPVIENAFNKALNTNIALMNSDKLDITIIKRLIKLVDFANNTKLSFKRKNAENKLFYLIKGKVKEMIVNASKTEEENIIIHNIIELASKLNVNTDEINILLNRIDNM